MNLRASFILAIGLLSAMSFDSVNAGNPNPLSGERFKFSSPPRWTYSGTWSPGGDDLLLVDVLANKIRIYDPQGQYQGNVSNQSGALSFSTPTAIHNASTNAYWVEDEDGRFLLLNSSNEIVKVLDILALAKSGEGELRAVYQWAPLDDSMLVFGDIEKGDSSASAFLKVPLDHPASMKILQKIPLSDPGRRLYMIGSPYVAVVGGEPYYLVMSEIPYVVTPRGERLQAVRITKAGREPLPRPKLPNQTGIASSKLLFQALEESALPAGIYGWHDALYVLMRSPSSLGVSVWSMLKIDPKTNQVEWRREVDSTANHLLVIPGDRYWAFIEKGKVNGPGQQAIDSFLRVPSKDF